MGVVNIFMHIMNDSHSGGPLTTLCVMLKDKYVAISFLFSFKMSARPRPVTSKFAPLTAGSVRPREYDLSSSGSTESLVSVLDHLSVDERAAVAKFSDDEAPAVVARKTEQPRVARKVRRKPEARRVRSSSAGEARNQTYTR